MKKLLYLGVAAILLVLVAYIFLFSAPSNGADAHTFVVHSGESLEQVAHNLSDQNLIRSSQVFLVMARLRGVQKIPTGRYQIASGLNVQDTLNAVAHPKQETIKVTIPEGYTLADVDEKLTKMGLIDAGEFSAATVGMEGYLFPDTYFVYNFNFDVKDLVSKMKNNFENKITDEIKAEVIKSKRTLTDIIIMASILEKEVRTDADYSVVSGILWKRLDSGWPLQADATLLYGKKTSRITKADLDDTDNPYNTRKRKGLTPTPINNPGMRAIRAATFPEKSEYWFYLTDSDGRVHYAVTNDEQNANRAKYIK